MVPKGWTDGKVGDLLVALESGVSVNGEDRPLSTGEKGVLKVSAVSYGKFNRFAAKAIEGNELARAKTNPQAGQIIISRSNTEELVGASAFIERDYPYLFLPDKLWQTVPKADADMKWLSYILASEHVRYTLSNLATGTSGSMKNITKGELLSLKISIPPLSEQKKVAQILSTWDKAITTTEKLLANSQQQKKALMQQLLTGKKRFPEFSGKWKEVKLNELCEVRRGASPRPINNPKWFSPAGRGWIRIADVTASKTENLLATTQYLSEEGSKSSVCVDPGDLIMSICGTIGVPKFIGIPACIHDGFVVFRNCSSDLSLAFLYHYLVYISEKLALGGQPGTQKNLNTGIVGNTKVPHLSKSEQQKIASVLSTADREIEVLQQKLDCLILEKKALMQQLLTGKRRVKVDKKEVA